MLGNDLEESMAFPAWTPARPLRLRTRRLGPVLAALLVGLALVLTLTAPRAWAASPAPRGLKVVSTTPASIKLSWTAVKGAPKYRVQYSTSAKMSKATYKRFTSTSAELTGLKAGTRYYVKVRVISKDGDNLGPYSKAVSGSTASGYAAPGGLKVLSTTPTSLKLGWTAVKGAPRYRVQYSTSASMAKPVYQRFTPASAELTGLKAGTRYYLKVRVITADGDNLSPYSKAISGIPAKAVTGPAPTTATLRVGSYNVKCFNCTGSQPNERSWWDRRDDLVANVKAQSLDVLGVQEASQAWLPAAEGGKGQDLSQFEDLRNRLGGGWTLANANRNNCVKAKTPSRCEYKDQGASNGTKILFDANRVELLDNGSKKLTAPGSTARYLAWAEFRQRSNGKKFFFADAHLEPNKDWDLHVKEATELAQEVARQNTGHLPTFVVGDFNSHKNTTKADGTRDNGIYDVMVDRFGYVDPLGNRSGTTTTTPGASVEKRVNTWLNSFNDYTAVPSPLYYGRRPNGTYIDYIFTTRKVRVLEWETVAKLDADHHYVGKQPSDHNLVRASVVLP